ncbi:NFAT activation molecule 1 [Apodemus sylvaticus]|uniref:NFAT activation molecule 1 n=1 Tax=Apodemus sylvaticus TaxID=10129 RepID=UPI002243057F|nr:NFAT activation molecule 1 [Apodemus sylvaticus]
MESRLPWCGARAGCLHPPSRLPAWCFLCLLLVPWTPQLAGGISVTHTSPPIRVSLANTDVSFSCRIQYAAGSEVIIFPVSFFHVDIHGKRSLEKPIDCQYSPGMENQTMDCTTKLSLPNASATGTYYCIVKGQDTCQSDGVFILVRDTAYQPPSFKVREALLLGFTSLMSVLGVLGTALLLWKKKQILVLGKHTAKTCPGLKSTIGTTKPPAESIYTSLQGRETEVYACIEGETGSPVSSQSPATKEKLNKLEDDKDFNLVYENL